MVNSVVSSQPLARSSATRSYCACARAALTSAKRLKPGESGLFYEDACQEEHEAPIVAYPVAMSLTGEIALEGKGQDVIDLNYK